MTTTKRKQAVSPAASPSQNGFSLISDEKLLKLYALLLKCRRIEEHVAILLKQDRGLPKKDKGSGGGSQGFGHEASAVGVAIDLLPEDTLALCDDGLIVRLVRGVPLKRLLAPWRARAAATRVSCAAQLKAALRAAATNKLEKNNRIAVAFCGALAAKSPAAQAFLREAMHRAGAEGLPMLFVCHSGVDAEDLAPRAQPYGFPCMVVDGADVVAIYRVASEVIAHARRGNGPTLIECKDVRPPGTEDRRGRMSGGAIVNMERYLAGKGLLRARFKAGVVTALRRELGAAGRLLTSRTGAGKTGAGGW